MHRVISRSRFLGMAATALALAFTSDSRGGLVHRYSFNDGTVNDSIGAANGTLVTNTKGNAAPAVSGGQLQLNNPGFSGPSNQSNYLSLPPSILPNSGSATIEQWFTFTGSGYYTEAYTFTDSANDANPPGASSGQYLMHTISNPAGGPGAPAQGGSSIAQSLAGYGGGAESRAFETTPTLGAGGGGYLDDGATYMAATVIDGTAGTLSYYVYRVSDGVGGLQQTIPAIPLSSYAFTNAYLGRSAFPGDNVTSGSVDEFRIYDNAQSAAQIAADLLAGPDAAVPEPGSMALIAGLGGLLIRRNRRRKG